MSRLPVSEASWVFGTRGPVRKGETCAGRAASIGASEAWPFVAVFHDTKISALTQFRPPTSLQSEWLFPWPILRFLLGGKHDPSYVMRGYDCRWAVPGDSGITRSGAEHFSRGESGIGEVGRASP